MKRINLEIYDQKDLLEVLNYAQEEYKYRAKFDTDGISKYWIQRIEQLKKVVKGERVFDLGNIQSSMLTMEDRR